MRSICGRTGRRRLFLPVRAGVGHRAERLFDHGAQLRVLEVACRRDDQVAADVGAPEVRQQHVAGEAPDRLGRAENRPAERVVAPVLLGEQLVDEIVGSVLDHLDLFEDHLLLALDLVDRKRRVQHQVRQDVEGPRQVLVHHLDVVAGVLLRRERVEVAAHRVELLRDLLRAAPLGALEEHVLDEVGDAALLGVLVTGATSQPHAETHRADMRHGLGDEPDAVRERVVNDHRRGGSRAPQAAAEAEKHRSYQSGTGSGSGPAPGSPGISPADAAGRQSEDALPVRT